MKAKYVPIYLSFVALIGFFASQFPLFAGGGAKEVKAEDDLKILDGKWICKVETFDGEEVPGDVAEKHFYTFKDGKVTIRGGLAKAGDKFIAIAREDVYKIELGKNGDVKTIDLVEDKEGGRKIPGIYKIEKEKFTICLNFKNTDRPEKFESKADTGIGLFEFEKSK